MTRASSRSSDSSTLAPIFFANLIFSVTLRDQELAEHVFGWNLIGATIGGVAEYASMSLGYSFLALVVAASYAAVIVLLAYARRARTRTAAAGAGSPALIGTPG